MFQGFSKISCFLPVVSSTVGVCSSVFSAVFSWTSFVSLNLPFCVESASEITVFLVPPLSSFSCVWSVSVLFESSIDASNITTDLSLAVESRSTVASAEAWVLVGVWTA